MRHQYGATNAKKINSMKISIMGKITSELFPAKAVRAPITMLTNKKLSMISIS
jgi:hypothetical protein